ncbi:MAG: YggT family protein [Sphingomicrobium sp.]
MIYTLIGIVDFILMVLTWIIFAQVILSWLVAFNVINTSSNLVRSLLRGLDRITAPLYRPVQKLLPDFGGIDFSPLVILLAIFLIRDKLLPGILLEVGPTIT